jgi:signal recognition particle GTPase
MYVKDQGEWEKEDKKKTKLTKVVKTIANKNITLLPQPTSLEEKYPDYNKSSSKTTDKYEKMVIESMTTDEDKNEKIITNISKATIIKDKSC